MFFNSLDFALFLPIVFILYWFVTQKSLRLQNLLIVGASYVFYGWWDWRFLSLIFFSTCIDYFVGNALHKSNSPGKRKILLWTSLLINLGFLGLFKYYNFFAGSFASAFSLLGMDIAPNSLNIILPVGISFYTFQTLSYTIDVYKGNLTPTKDFISFAAFVSFFPQLVAGPIERATHLLPQFYTKRNFDHDKAVDGVRQMAWGLFKKVVIADNAALFANMIFNNYTEYSGSTLLLGALFFTFQIYGDFSGYSDIAIGASRLFGFDLCRNFAFPYFSRDIAEFWRRWHISLSTWFRDYIYIPLGGSRGGLPGKLRNTMIIFIVSGLWHGANWTFVIWGALNALYFIPLLLMKRNRINTEIVAKGKKLPSPKEIVQMGGTFTLVVFAWIFFRAESVSQAINYIRTIFSHSLFTVPEIGTVDGVNTISFLLIIIAFMIVEWFGREQQYAIAGMSVKQPRIVRWSLYMGICITISLFSGSAQEFIYFQF